MIFNEFIQIFRINSVSYKYILHVEFQFDAIFMKQKMQFTLTWETSLFSKISRYLSVTSSIRRTDCEIAILLKI